MNANPGIDATAAANIDEAVRRIIQTPDFQASPRICAFLRFIVRETLEGRGAQLKAFSIAVAVYERDESFDPQTSSIVRVEASRLRRLLERYYEGPGQNDRVRIGLPRGSYTPSFILLEKPDNPEPPAAKTGFVRFASPWSGGALAALLLAAIAVAAAVWPRLQVPASPAPAPPPVAMRPVLTVQLPGLEPADKQFERLQDLKTALEGALIASEHVTVIEIPTSRDTGAEYRVEIRANDSSPDSTEFRAVYETTGEILWSRREPVDLAPALLMQRVASALSQPSGIVFADQRRRFASAAPENRPFNCIIKGYDFLLHPSSGSYNAAVECLDRAVQAFPEFQIAIAMLASIHADAHIFGFRREGKAQPLELAISAAQLASRISSHSVRTKSVLFRVQYLEKRYDAAFEAGARAIAEYPHAATLLGRIGAAYVLRGDYEKGERMLAKALAINEGLTPMMAPFNFIAAYMEGNEQRAMQWASNRTAFHASPLLLISRIIMAHKRGEIDNVLNWSKRLQERFPEFAAGIAAGLERYGMTDEIRKRMLDDLRQAGLLAPESAVKKQ